MLCFIWLLAIMVLLGSSVAHSAEQSYAIVSRCVFVYAPIFETGKKLQNQSIFYYGQKRIAWAGGYVQAQQNNLAFKKVFESNLATNKKRGVEIEQRLTNAVRRADIAEYQAIMGIARQCDQQLRLPSNDIPPF